MIIKTLSPDQILTLNDYPVHSEQVLKLYHRMFWKGGPRLVPPVPVISIENGQLRCDGNDKKTEGYHKLLETFIKHHPKVKYCILDGSHKTTAAALCRKNIKVMVFAADKDIRDARTMVEKGDLLSLSVGKTNRLEDAIDIVRAHFLKTMRFETVKEKTDRMVKDKVVSKYMIGTYKK